MAGLDPPPCSAQLAGQNPQEVLTNEFVRTPDQITAQGHEGEKNFFVTDVLTGKLSCDGWEVDDLEVHIRYSSDGSFYPHAEVRGNRTQADKLADLKGAGVEFLGYSTTNPRVCHESKHARFIRQGYHFPDFHGAAKSAVFGSLEFDSYRTLYYISNDNRRKETTRYLLRGDDFLLLPSGYHMPEIDGSIKLKGGKLKIELPDNCPVEAKSTHHYLYDRDKNHPKIEQRLGLRAIEFTKSAKSSRKLRELLDITDKLTDDILLLVSFVSSAWCDWFTRIERSNGLVIVSWKRPTQNYSKRRPEIQLSNRKNLREAVSRGLGILANQNENEGDIREALRSYVVGCEAEYIEAKLVNYAIAFEQLRNLHQQRTRSNVGRILPGRQFKSIRGKLEETLKANLGNEQQCNQIRNRLPELNRPPLKSDIYLMLEYYGVAWQDLCPSGRELMITKTRNDILHGRTPDNEVTYHDAYRYKHIVRRLLFQMLGSEPPAESAEWLRLQK